MERRIKMAVSAAALHPKTKRFVAYQVMQIDQKLLAKVASKGAREGLERGLFVAARVGLKAVPVIGWISLAYFAYSIGIIRQRNPADHRHGFQANSRCDE